MKKSVALLILVASVVMSSCSSYTCPTYSKAPQKALKKETRIWATVRVQSSKRPL